MKHGLNPRMENLRRGVAAIHQGEGRVFVSWRFLGTDPDGTAFNLYRLTGNAQPVKLNAQPMSTAPRALRTRVWTSPKTDVWGISSRNRTRRAR